jgi:hypothetical protein
VRIHPRDAVNIAGESDSLPAVLVDAFVVDTTTESSFPRSAEEVRRWMAARLDVSPVFTRSLQRRALDLGDPFWVDTRPDLVRQVHVCHAAERGWAPVERLISHKLSTRTPSDAIWDMTVMHDVCGVQGLPDRSSIVVLQIHHAALDGLGIAEVMAGLFSSHAHVERTSNSRRERIPSIASDVARLPGRLATTVRAWRSRRRTNLDDVTRVENEPLKDLHIRVAGGAPVVRTLWRPLDDLRAATRAFGHGVTINDLALTVVSESLRRWLASQGIESQHVSAMVPVDTGSAAADSANKTRFLRVDLHADVADLGERVVVLHHEIAARRAVLMGRPPGAPAPIEVAPPIVARAVARVAAAAMREARVDLSIVSNIRHPDVPLAFGDAPVVAGFHPLVVGGGIGVAHNVTSVAGQIGLTITAAPEVMTDPDRYALMVAEALDDVMRAMVHEEPSWEDHPVNTFGR